MSRKFIYIFILSLLKMSTVTSMKPNDFCSLPDELYPQVKCKHHQCTSDICSVNKEKCEKFLEWSNLISRYMNADFAKNSLIFYKEFVIEIKICSENKYVFLRTELCQNKRICYEKKKWSTRFMFKGVDILEKKLCSCKDKHEFDCSNGFCASSKEICKDIFITYRQQYSRVLNQTSICV
jgi:hypothetical protein